MISVAYIESIFAVPPKMKSELDDNEGVQGTDLYMSCSADGFPAPTYKFYKVCLVYISGAHKWKSIATLEAIFDELIHS